MRIPIGLGCPREDDVRAAAGGRRWTSALHAHASGCRHCGDVALVASVLAQPSDAGRLALGDPSVLWVQARLRRRLRAETQISRVLTTVQTMTGLLLVAGLGYVGSVVDVWSRVPVPAAGVALVTCLPGLLLLLAMFLARKGGAPHLRRPSRP